MPKVINIPGVKVLTDDEKYQQQQAQLEVTLGRLQTEYLLLSHDHDLSQYSKANKLKTHNRILSIFQRESQEISTNLGVAKSKKKIDEKHADVLKEIVDQYDIFTENVATAKQTVQQIVDQIKMVKKRVHHLNTLQVTDRQIQERVWKAAKTVEILENKLDVQIKKFCTIVGKNQEMRREIDYLLVDRSIFYQIWTKFIDKLVHGKKIMMDIIEQATIAYDQREEWCHKLNALRTKADIDLQQRIAEIRVLHWKNVDQEKIADFMNIKNQRRYMRDLKIKAKETHEKNFDKLKEKVKHYEDMIKQATDFTKETKLAAIGLKFRQEEQKNFMKFQFIIDLIKSMENVNDELSDLHDKVDNERILFESRKVQQNSRIVELEDSLEQKRKNYKERKKYYDDILQRFEKMLKGITTLFSICKCNNDPLIQLLGDNSTINPYNIDLYLQILESSVHEILLKYNFKLNSHKMTQKKTSRSSTALVPGIMQLEEMLLSSPCALCVEYEMVNDSVEKVQKVLSRAEAKKQLEKIQETPDCQFRIHNISHCQLPKAREIMQRRYIN